MLNVSRTICGSKIWNSEWWVQNDLNIITETLPTRSNPMARHQPEMPQLAQVTQNEILRLQELRRVLSSHLDYNQPLIGQISSQTNSTKDSLSLIIPHMQNSN